MRISEFAKETGFSEDTLRYYERIGLLGRVLRDGAGHRVYRAEDLRWAAFLARLKATGMPIAFSSPMPGHAPRAMPRCPRATRSWSRIAPRSPPGSPS